MVYKKIVFSLQFFILCVLVGCNSIVFCAELNASASFGKNERQIGAVERIKGVPNAIGRGFRKIYHCIAGNHQTCTFNEIIAARVIVVTMLAKVGQVSLHQRMQSAPAGAPRPRSHFDDMSDYLQQVLYDSFDNADRYAGRTHAADVKVDREQIESERTEFLREKSIPTQEDPAESAGCCVCLNENSEELQLDYIPCQSDTLHSDKLCLSCLDILINSHQVCPICRASWGIC